MITKGSKNVTKKVSTSVKTFSCSMMLCLAIPAWAGEVAITKVDDPNSKISPTEIEEFKTLPDGTVINGDRQSFIKLKCKSLDIGLSTNGKVPSDWKVHENEKFPYTVKEWSCSVWGRAETYWNRFVAGTSGPETCVSSIDKISIPMLSNPNAKLVAAGSNSFWLGWKGGKISPNSAKPLYVIEVFQLKNNQEVNITTHKEMGNGECKKLKEAEIKLPAPLVKDGQYKVKITDGFKYHAEGKFTVISSPREKLPGEQEVLQKCQQEEGGYSQICLALWVASQNDGEWALDAYQQAAKMAGTAEYVRLTIAHGKHLWDYQDYKSLDK